MGCLAFVRFREELSRRILIRVVEAESEPMDCAAGLLLVA